MLTHAELAHYACEAYEHANIQTPFDIEILVLEDGMDVVVAIRGSEIDARDWLRNFAFWPGWFTKIGRAPYGFGKGASRVIDRLIIGWSGVLVGKNVYVTGHSLGGAMAILVAHALKQFNYNVVECVAFAAPCTGKRKLIVPTTVYDHDGDPVCKVPFFWKQPVERNVLHDVSDGPLQHSMDYYLLALEQLEQEKSNG